MEGLFFPFFFPHSLWVGFRMWEVEQEEIDGRRACGRESEERVWLGVCMREESTAWLMRERKGRYANETCTGNGELNDSFIGRGVRGAWRLRASTVHCNAGRLRSAFIVTHSPSEPLYIYFLVFSHFRSLLYMCMHYKASLNTSSSLS